MTPGLRCEKVRWCIALMPFRAVFERSVKKPCPVALLDHPVFLLVVHGSQPQNSQPPGRCLQGTQSSSDDMPAWIGRNTNRAKTLRAQLQEMTTLSSHSGQPRLARQGIAWRTGFYFGRYNYLHVSAAEPPLDCGSGGSDVTCLWCCLPLCPCWQPRQWGSWPVRSGILHAMIVYWSWIMYYAYLSWYSLTTNAKNGTLARCQKIHRPRLLRITRIMHLHVLHQM